MKRRHPLVVGKAAHLGKQAQPRLAAVQQHLPCLGIEDVEVIGGLKERNVFFDQKQIVL